MVDGKDIFDVSLSPYIFFLIKVINWQKIWQKQLQPHLSILCPLKVILFLWAIDFLKEYISLETRFIMSWAHLYIFFFKEKENKAMKKDEILLE